MKYTRGLITFNIVILMWSKFVIIIILNILQNNCYLHPCHDLTSLFISGLFFFLAPPLPSN